MNKGIIHIEMEGVSQDQTLILQKTIHTLIEKGALSLKNGTVTLSFDHKAELMSMRFDAVVWKKVADRGVVIDGPLHKELKGDKIVASSPKLQTMDGKVNPSKPSYVSPEYDS